MHLCDCFFPGRNVMQCCMSIVLCGYSVVTTAAAVIRDCLADWLNCLFLAPSKECRVIPSKALL